MGTYLVDVDMAGGKKLGSGNVFLIINDMAVAYNERLDGEVERTLGLRIFVGRVDIGFLNRLIIDNVIIYDKEQVDMLKAGRISAKFDIIDLSRGRITRDVEKPFNSCHINNYEVQNYKFFLTYTEIYLFFFRCLRFFEYFCIGFLESIGIKTDVYKNTLIYLLVWQM